MSPFLRAISDWLYYQGVETAKPDEDGVISFPFKTRARRWQVVIWAPDRDRVMFLSIMTAVVPPRKRPPMAELLMRIDQHLIDGTFDLNMDTGELRCRTVATPLGSEPLDAWLQAAFLANVVAMDTFLPAIEDVLLARRPPTQALAAALNNEEDEG